ncbi:MAG: type I methionyl aminopeptidase [Thermoguttaceae bacterium]|nr:type I methionyl aminopeptidase [Thermoguttaceae bacterium]MBP3693200.1 type I methionyl aminopeptidase [Thermoguttaceae bacterium]
MIELKTKREIRLMRRAGLQVWHAHQLIKDAVKPGITTREANELVEKYFHSKNIECMFKGVQLHSRHKPFPAACCMSVNEEVVHGIPSDRVLVEGDVLSVDIGSRIAGWCGDSAATYAVGKISAEKQKLLDVTKGTLDLAISLLSQKTHWNAIAKEMEIFVEDHGFSVVDDFVGHGIGREMHMEPQVANYYCPHADFRIQTGLVIAIEPMVNVGTHKVREGKDGWVQSTADGKPSAHFEHTVAITENGPYVLTASDDDYNNKAFLNY